MRTRNRYTGGRFRPAQFKVLIIALVKGNLETIYHK